MTFNIIRNARTPHSATLADGTIVHRQEFIFVEPIGKLIPCAPYDDHFIYENPDKSKGTPAFLCTCGSVAVMTEHGLMVCLFDLNTGLTGKHATSLYNLREWDKVKGQKLDMDRIRKELI